MMKIWEKLESKSSYHFPNSWWVRGEILLNTCHFKKLWGGQEDQRKPRTSELFDSETFKQFSLLGTDRYIYKFGALRKLWCVVVVGGFTNETLIKYNIHWYTIYVLLIQRNCYAKRWHYTASGRRFGLVCYNVIHVVDKMSCAWVVSVCICLSWMLWLVLSWDLFFVTQHPEASQSEAWPRWRWSVSYSVSRTITESCSHAAVMLSCSVQNLISRSHSSCL